MRLLAYLAFSTALLIQPASAICFDPSFFKDAPSPPTRVFSSRPSVPYCLSEYKYSQRHTCSQWELDSYFDDVKDYADDMQRYYDEAVAFANEAAAYADEAARFSNRVYDYAVCESKDANTQHE